MQSRAVSQTYLRTDNEGSRGILFTDEVTPNKDALCNGGTSLWPRKTAIAEAAEAMDVNPEDIAGVKMTLTFFTVD